MKACTSVNRDSFFNDLYCSVCQLARIVKLGVVSIEMDSKTERFHKFLNICCVQDVQDWAQY